MNLIIAVFYRRLSSSERGLKNSCLNGDSNPDLCDAGAVLHQLSYQANWEQVVVWDDYKPVDGNMMIIQEFSKRANSPVTKRVEACVRNATAKHAWIVWLDRTAIFKVKSSCISLDHRFLSSQTIPACFAIALWTHSSTRFVAG